MSWIVEILLPVRDPDGQPYPEALFEDLQRRLTKRFGGVTSYLRSPAKGRWRSEGAVEEDDVVLIEVMVPSLERDWWAGLREGLETALRQREIVIRAHEIERL